jgi:hypothetical protein
MEVGRQRRAQIDRAAVHLGLEKTEVDVEVKVLRVRFRPDRQALGMEEERIQRRQARGEVEAEREAEVHLRLEVDRPLGVKLQAERLAGFAKVDRDAGAAGLDVNGERDGGEVARLGAADAAGVDREQQVADADVDAA